jgi:hypothetical protein
MPAQRRFCAATVLACGFAILIIPSQADAASPGDFPIVGSGIVVHPEHPEDAVVSSYQAMLGRGFNTFTSTMRGDCVNMPFVSPGSEGYNTHTEISLIQSSEDLKRQTSIDVSGSTGFGMVSVEASASFNSSMHFSTNSDYLLVRVTAVGPSVGGGTGEVGNLAVKTKGNPQQFFTACGNRYISEIQLGGEFMALLEFTSSSETDRKEVQANLKVASAASSLSASFKTAVEQAQAKSSMHMTISRRGTSDALPEQTVDKLLEYSRDFPSKLNIKTVVPVGLVVSDYQSLDPELNTIEEEPDVDRVRQNLRAVSDELAEIDYLTGAYRSLGIVGRSTTIEQVRTMLASKPAAMRQALGACGKAPWTGSCKFSAAVLDVTLPPVPPRPTRVGYTSGNGNENLVSVLEKGQEATLLITGRFIYKGDGSITDAASNTQIVLMGADGSRTVLPYRAAQTIKGPVTISVAIADSNYDDNKDVEMPTALLY